MTERAEEPPTLLDPMVKTLCISEHRTYQPVQLRAIWVHRVRYVRVLVSVRVGTDRTCSTVRLTQYRSSQAVRQKARDKNAIAGVELYIYIYIIY